MYEYLGKSSVTTINTLWRIVFFACIATAIAFSVGLWSLIYSFRNTNTAVTTCDAVNECVNPIIGNLTCDFVTGCAPPSPPGFNTTCPAGPLGAACINGTSITCPAGPMDGGCINGSAITCPAGPMDVGCIDTASFTCSSGPLQSACINGSAITCPAGPPDPACFPAVSCPAVTACVNGSSLTLDTLTVTTLVVQNITQSDISYQDVFEVDDLILNGTMICTSNNVISDSCLPDRIATINAISPFNYDFTIVGGPGIAVTGGTNSITISNNINITLIGPVFIIKNLFGVLTIIPQNQTANTVFAGPVSGSPLPPTFRLLQPVDLPQLNLSDTLNFIGILPQSQGGTGVSGQYLISGNGTTVVVNPNGTLSVDFTATVVTLVDLSVPTSIFTVTSSPITSTGTLSFIANTQAANTVWAGPIAGPNAVPSFRLLQLMDLPLIDLTNHVFGVLPVANGGTGSATPMVGGGIMVSLANNTIVEGALVGLGPGIIVTQTDATTFSIGTSALLNASISVPTSIFSVGTPTIYGPGSGTLAFDLVIKNANTVWAGPATGAPAQPTFRSLVNADIPSTLALSGLSVSGSTLLGSATSCITPLLPSCYDISSQSCPTGSLSANCIPSTLHLNSLVVDSLTILNGSISEASFTNNSFLGDVSLNGTFMCDTTGSISQNCLNLGGFSCPMGMPLAESCIPASLVMQNVAVLNNLTVNNVYCNGPPIQDSCIPTRIMTINAIFPTAAPVLDFSILQSTGISITPIANGITIANTGVTSVALAAPVAEFVVSGSPVTTTGTLTLTKQTQLAKTVWAGPTSGPAAQPTFRLLEFADLPDLNLTGTNGITVVNGTIITGNGATVSSVGLSLPVSVFSVTVSPITTTGSLTAVFIDQSQKRFFAGPTSGADATPTFRLIQVSDLPALPQGGVYVGTGLGSVVSGTLNGYGGITITSDALGTINITGSGGTLTSVDLVAPAELVVSGSPLTGSGGTITLTKANQVKNTFWAGPTTGANAQPSFRTIGMTDFDALGMTDGQLIIGSTGGTPVLANLLNGSNIVITNTPGGILISSSINSSAIGTVFSVGLSLPSIFSVSGSPVTTSGTLIGTLTTQTANLIFAGPGTGVAAVPTFRSMVVADLPTLTNGQFYIGQDGNGATVSSLVAGSGIAVSNTGGTTTISTAISVGLSLPSIFSVSGSPVTTTGTLTGTLATQTANRIFAGPSSGGAATPTFRALALADLPTLTNGQIYIGNAGVATATSLSAGTGITITPGPGTLTITNSLGGTVTSVALSLPSIFSVSGSPVTASGTLTGTLTTQTANRFFAGPTTGVAATPTFRAMVVADLPALSNGQVYVGNAGVATATTLTAGTGISITNGAGSITIANTATGTVSSVALSLPSIFSVTGSPVTTSGTLTGTLVSQNANAIFVAPDGVSGTPTFRAQVLGDLPRMTNGQVYIGSTGSSVVASTLTAGAGISISLGAGSVTIANTASGSVVSVGLSLPSIFSVSGSPVTTSGTLTGTLVTQSANTFFAGPTSGGAATPAFRALVSADLPPAYLLIHHEVSSTVTISGFSSGSFTIATTMTVTPAAGTWFFSFSTLIQPSSSSATYEIEFFNGASGIPHSQRALTGSSSAYTAVTQAVTICDGVTPVTLQWRKASGSGSADMFARSMFVLRVT